jgi:GNAT superfamily N-acetyltransferase
VIVLPLDRFVPPTKGPRAPRGSELGRLGAALVRHAEDAMYPRSTSRGKPTPLGYFNEGDPRVAGDDRLVNAMEDSRKSPPAREGEGTCTPLASEKVSDFVPISAGVITSSGVGVRAAEGGSSAPEAGQSAPIFIPSRLFGYALTKKLDGISGAGTTGWWASRVLKGYGFCEERLLPYGTCRSEDEVPRVAMSPEAYRDGYRHRAFAYQRLYSVNDVKRALARPICGLPLLPLLSFRMFESIRAAPNGRVPLPGHNERSAIGHCVLVVGYDDNDRTLKFMNSWGPGWGDKGIGYLPYEYFSRNLVTETWVFLPNELGRALRTFHGHTVFRDGRRERVKAEVSSVFPPAWGRPNLWVMDLYDREYRIIGWAYCTPFVDRDVLEIEELFVKPEHRRSGLGNDLLAEIETIAKFHVLSKMRAWIPNQDVIPGRDFGVRAFFSQSGFTIYSDRSRAKDYYWYRAEKTVQGGVR